MPPDPAATALMQAERLLQDKRFDQARGALARALDKWPGDPRLHKLNCYTLSMLGDFDGAATSGARARKAFPDHPDLLVNLGSALTALDRIPEAIDVLAAALAAAPQNPDVRARLCSLLVLGKQFVRAEAETRKALALHPRVPALLRAHASALRQLGRLEDGMRVLVRAVEDHPADPDLLSDLCATLTYTAALPAHDVAARFRSYGALLDRLAAPLGPPPPHDNSPDPERRLRIGLVSPDLRRHPVTVFLRPLFVHLDRERFDLACYSTGGQEDAVTQALKPLATLWRRSPHATAPELARAIRDDSIDILFDLSGHSAGHALAAFQRRPAPIQITWLGFPNTTGLSQMDYRLVDSVSDPVAFDGYATERMLRLDPCYLCYAPEPGAPAPGPSPAMRGEAFTFGSYNNLAKFDEPVVALWSRLLREIPGSRLALKHSGLTDPGVAPMMAARFARHGVTADRLVLRPPDRTYLDFLATYNDVDLALDPFPFNGATTTCDSLFMGAPVLTLRGDRPAARVSESILRCIGMDELVAKNEDEYVAIARGLAADVSRLASIRAGLRERFLASPLCDGAGFCRRFESAMRSVWREYCASSAPGLAGR